MENFGIFSELTKGCKFNTKQKNKKDSVVVKKPKKSRGFFDLLKDSQTEQKQNIEKIDFAGNSESLRKKFKIHVNGTDIPSLIKGFDDLESLRSFNSICIENIHKNFKFTNLTPVQMQVIPAMIHERNVMVCAPTGSGKTLAFLLPVLHHLLQGKKADYARALIVCPTKELAAQIYKICHLLLIKDETCQALGTDNNPLNVQILDKDNMKSCVTKGLEFSKGWDLLISTPNSIAYLLKKKTPKVNLDCVEWLVVDESDKVFEVGSDEGKGFRNQLETIYTSCTNKKIKRAFFSATYAHDVEKWCIENLHNVLQVIVGGRSTAVDSVEQSLQYVGNEEGKVLAIRELINRKGFKPPALVFVQSKQRAESLYAELVYDNRRADVIHGDKTDEEREQAIMKFRTAQSWLLICTDILGRGIDIKCCNLVINYDFPSSTQVYIHRIGRTGRAGRKGKAVTFYTNKDKPLLRSIANIIKQQGGYVPEYLLNLKKISKEDRKELAKKQVKRKNVLKRQFTADEYIDKKDRLQEKKIKKRKKRMDKRKSKIAKLEAINSETNVSNNTN